jgi:hypothetical protein
MNPQEVAGLQGLARAHGTSLTINPHTGMPEAFSLGGLFKSILPMIAGFALGPGGFDLFDSALTTGLAVGAGTGLLTGNLGQGLMAGLGAYGGFGLSDTFSKMGGLKALAPGQSTADLNASVFGNQGINTVGNAITPVNAALPGEALSTNALEANVNNLASSTPQTQYGLTNGLSKGIGGPGINLQNISTSAVPGGSANIPLSLTDTASKSLTAPTSLYGKYIEAGGTPGQLLTTAGGIAAGGIDLTNTPNLQANVRTKHVQTGVDANGKPVYSNIPLTAYSPYETLNLNDPYSAYGVKAPPSLVLPETRLVAKGGIIHGYAGGGSVAGMPTPFSGGVSDQYNIPDGTPAQNTPSSPYGIGRLNNLAAQQSDQQAKTLGYAHGGYLDGQGDGMSDSIPATIEGKQPARLADGEFVVPADVVSHLGNGSSKAGSQRLYAMLDKVRKARTGHTKQGRQINPSKYLPA